MAIFGHAPIEFPHNYASETIFLGIPWLIFVENGRKVSYFSKSSR